MSGLLGMLTESLLLGADYQSEDQEEKDTLAVLSDLLEKDTGTYYPLAFQKAKDAENRGALRALTWGKKVSAIQKSLLKRYKQAGGDFSKGDEALYVCEACGFIYTGISPPEICPVCKAPSSRFTKA